MPSECTTKPLQRELADAIIRLVSLDDIRILIACGAKVNDAVTQGLRPIHYAVWQRYSEAVRLLLVRGCDVNSTDDCGYSPLHLAAEHNYTEMMKMLLENGAKTDYRDNISDGVLYPATTLSEEPLHLAIKNQHFNAARLLLGKEALMIIYGCSLAGKNGANPNARYFFGSEINLISPLDVEYLDLLLTYGADPDARDRQGLTPLMRACRIPQAMESVLCLLKHGANVNAMADERHDYRTVLHYAVLSGNRDIVSLLLKQGARVNFPVEYQKPTPLDLTILRGDPNLVKLFLEAGANVNSSSPIIGSPLHVVCSDNISNRLKILHLLLEHGADPNKVVISDDGMPLKSVLGEYLSSNSELDQTVIKTLMRYGAKVIFKSQFRHPLGILNCMQSVSQDQGLFLDLADTAEEFDPPMIRRCAALSPAQKEFLLHLSRNPKTLQHQTRLFLRKLIGKQLPYIVDQLGLPRILTHMLLFEIS